VCLIIYQPEADEPISRETFQNSWSSNNDGAGYMFSDGKQLVLRKPFKRLKHLIKSYERDHATFGFDSSFVVHFRFSTHGTNNVINTHPHPLADGMAGLVHNGILPVDPPSGAGDISDTVYFCRTVLSFRSVNQLMDENFHDYLENIIGMGNKLAIMDFAGNVAIVNEDMGMWDGVRWYSNGGYKKAFCRYIKPSGYYKSEWANQCYTVPKITGTPMIQNNTTTSVNGNVYEDADKQIQLFDGNGDIVPLDPNSEAYYDYWDKYVDEDGDTAMDEFDSYDDYIAHQAQLECDVLNREAIEALEDER
jgi:predicted glutamine amidotransferase